MGIPLLSLSNIHKRFPGVYALKGAGIEIQKGEVHALIGENGAGKSTLIKIIAGAYDFNGEYQFEGSVIKEITPKKSIDLGISVIYQELNIIPALSVAENIFFGDLPVKFGKVCWNQLYANTEKVIAQVGLKVQPKRQIQTLKVAQQQLVEIAKAISHNAKLVIMDEPTSALSSKEVSYLFQIVKLLQSQGVSILYVSHKLEEIMEIADRVTVLRDGEYIATKEIKETSIADMVHMMVGRELTQMFPQRESPLGDVCFQVQDLSTAMVHNISFHVRKGEIVGFSGLMGAGRTELANALIGADRQLQGDILLDNCQKPPNSTVKARKMGIGLIPEDRKRYGIFADQSVKSNITVSSLEQFLRFFWISKSEETLAVDQVIKKVTVKTPSLEQLISKLSGGNQQKAIISRWLLKENLKVLIVDEPTRGIDVGAKAEIYELMNNMVAQGLSIIVMSSEMPELLGMCDRIYVMKSGSISGELSKEEVTQEKLLHLAITESAVI